MKYDAITIDSQVVCANAYDFNSGLLAQLKQFASGPIRVAVSQIVASELLRQLKNKVEEATRSVKTAHKDAIRYGLRNPDEPAFAGEPDAANIAKSKLRKYFEEIGAEIVPYDNVAMSEVLDMYFRAKPPFAEKGKKKSEFPDAIALLSLERWATKNKLRLLAVSGDGDWQRFAKGSEIISVVEGLPEALEELQEHADEAAQLAQRILSRIESGEAVELRENFERSLANEVSGQSPYIEADSSFSVESEQADLSLVTFEFVGENGSFDARVVQVNHGKITISIELTANVEIEAYFNFSVHDSVDDDYVAMGSSVERRRFALGMTILATFEGDFPEGDIDVAELEIVSAPKSIHFGTVHPDWDEDVTDYEPPADEEPWTDFEVDRGEL